MIKRLSKLIRQPSSTAAAPPPSQQARLQSMDKNPKYAQTEAPSWANNTDTKLKGSAPADVVFNTLVQDAKTSSLGSEGIIQLLQQLDFEETDVKMLLFLYKCSARSLLDITREEFCHGLEALGASDILALRKRLCSCAEALADDEEEFLSFYKYVFQACREGTIKTIPKESVTYLLPICLSLPEERYRRYTKDFCEFLQSQESIKHIKSDEWISFLTFSKQVDDLKHFEANESDGHWPLIIDSFVEWKNEK